MFKRSYNFYDKQTEKLQCYNFLSTPKKVHSVDIERTMQKQMLFFNTMSISSVFPTSSKKQQTTFRFFVQKPLTDGRRRRHRRSQASRDRMGCPERVQTCAGRAEATSQRLARGNTARAALHFHTPRSLPSRPAWRRKSARHSASHRRRLRQAQVGPKPGQTGA